jgi:uncharacterized NAD(P)/FAD-binding protein YdhS
MAAGAFDVDVAIVGGGYCGVMLATYLSAVPDLQVAAFERAAWASGVAYATKNPRHLLNLRAGKMSAFADRDDDFVEWAGDVARDAFVPRRRYGDYLRSVFERSTEGVDRIHRLHSAVMSIEEDGGGFRVVAEHETIRAAIVVLALGTFAPSDDFVGDAARASAQYVSNPWAVPFDDLRGDIMLIGSGLTAIDVVVELEHRGYDRDVYMLSRHGLLPQVHRDYGDPIESTLDTSSALSMLRSVRAAIARAEHEDRDWQAVIDGIRPLTQGIWQSWPVRERERFLRHLRAFWETSRRRVPPEVEQAVRDMRNRGRLHPMGARIQSIEPRGGRFRVTARHADETVVREVDWLINCTGPRSDVARIDDPLVRSLLDGGLLRPHATRVGVDATPDGRAIDRDGNVRDRLLVAGSFLRGVLYESVSVPELRVQVRTIAEHISETLVREPG